MAQKLVVIFVNEKGGKDEGAFETKFTVLQNRAVERKFGPRGRDMIRAPRPSRYQNLIL